MLTGTNSLSSVSHTSTVAHPKILLVRLSALGDVVQTFPVVTYIRRAFPNGKIGWVVDADLVPVVENYPGLDYVHACNRKAWVRAARNPASWKHVGTEILQFINEIRHVHYDVALDVQGLFKTAVITQFSGAKRRIGLDHGRELTSFFYDQRFVKHEEYFDESVSRMEHMRVLGRAIGCPDLDFTVETPILTSEAEMRIGSLLASHFVAEGPLVAMAPGTQWKSKAWPVEHWQHLTQELLRKSNANLVFVAAKSDAALVSQIIGSSSPDRLLNLAGNTSVQELYALFAKTRVIIGSDSAPLHIAGAMKTPTLIGLYGPTGYRRTAPLGSESIVLFSSEGELTCQPCHKKSCPLGTTECMLRINPQSVLSAVLEALNANQGMAIHGTKSITRRL